MFTFHKKIKDFSIFFNDLINSKEHFVLRVSNETFQIKTDFGNFIFSNKKIGVKDFAFIKKFINNVNLDIPISNKDFIFFSKNSPKSNCEFDRCYEIDINSAYLTTAKNLGIIDNNLYELGMKQTKAARLYAVGSLAKKIKVYEIIEGKLQFTRYEHHTEKHKLIWKEIVSNVGFVIDAVSNKLDSFLFFWVDAIFVQNESDSIWAQKLFSDFGYESKIKVHKKIIWNQDECYFAVVQDKKGKYGFPCKIYHFPNEQKQISDIIVPKGFKRNS
jgi:hypothetical protein